MSIGKKIKNLRVTHKMTQEFFAEKIGVSRSTLSCYETGQRTPNIKTLQTIAQLCGVGLEYFGINGKDEAFDLLARAKDVFDDPNVSEEIKEKLYQEFMKMYLKMKG